MFGKPRSLAVALLLLGGAVLLSSCAPRQAAPPPTSEPEPGSRVIEHQVLAGESLARIADNYYGDPGRAADIARDNGLSDADGVAEGSVLALRFGPLEWEGARKRAAALDAYNHGVDLLGQERLAEAEKQFQLALKTAPDLLGASYNLALVQMRRGKSDSALDLLTGLTEARPADTDFRFARGSALFQLTRFDEAADEFNRVLKLDPAHTRAAFGLARAYQAADRKKEALAAWERYLELDSTSSWADTARRNHRKLKDGTP